MIVGKLTTSSIFRDIIHTRYPALVGNSAFQSYFHYLAFGHWLDEKTGLLLIPQELLAHIEKKTELLKTNNYVALDFLVSFSKQVQYHEWSNWSWREKECRVVTKLEWPEDVQQAIDAEREKVWREEEQVYFHTGKPFNRKSQKKQRDEELEYALQNMKAGGVEEAMEVLEYLHTLPPHVFNPLRDNLPKAYEVAKSLPNEQAVKQQLNLLKHFAAQTMPIYTNSHKTTRIFPINASIGSMQKDVRRALASDWVELDLRSAELAIIAKVWNIPEVTAFLQEGKKIWKYLAEQLGIDLTDETKAILKDGLYALCFGAGEKTLRKELKSLGVAHTVERFLGSPLMQAILIARDREIQKIRNTGQATNYFGQTLFLSDLRDPLSILSGVVQSYELALLYPAFQLANDMKDNKHGFKICIFQHDGFSISLAREDEADKWIGYLQEVVGKKAQEFGIITNLEVAYRPLSETEKLIKKERKLFDLIQNKKLGNHEELRKEWLNLRMKGEEQGLFAFLIPSANEPYMQLQN